MPATTNALSGLVIGSLDLVSISQVEGMARHDRRWAGLIIVMCLAAIAIAVFTTAIEVPWPWTDEGATYTALWRDGHQLLVLLRGPDAPLVPYYIIAKGWVSTVQAVWPAVSTLVALRLLSAVAATGTVLVLYTLVARNAGRFAGLLAGLLLISIPGFNRFAQEARGYTLLALAATASWLAWDYWLKPNRDHRVADDPNPQLGQARRVLADLVRVIPYTASIVAVAAIHTFGIFQWPAHALATVSWPRLAHRSRGRSVLALGGIMLVGAALVARQVAVSVGHGTGPVAADALQNLTAWQLLEKLHQAISFSGPPLASAVLLGLAVIGGVLAFRGRHAPFSRSLVIWLMTPLLLELAAASVRTNLFRLRYWITFLPPLAALAGLGAAAIAAALARVLRARLERLGRPAVSRWLPRAAAAVVTVTILGAQVAPTLPAQADMRAPGGHGQNLTGILAIIARVREANPGIPILIPSPSGAGVLACIDPALRDNPLRHFDPKIPTVFMRPTAKAKVRLALEGERRLLWIYQAPLGTPTTNQVPPALGGLPLEVTSVTVADLGWTALMLERTRTPA